MSRPSANERGFALLIVLWTLVPVSILLLLMAGTARSDALLAGNLRDAAVLQAAADGGIETGIFTLLRPGATLEPIGLRIGGAAVEVRLTSLSGLMNPNIVTPELLQAVLVRLGTPPAAAEALTAAVLDWRTPGQQARAGGSKLARYQAAGRDYGPPGAPFESIGELRQVLGMTPAIFTALEPLLTLYTERPPIASLAPPVLRDALNEIGARAAAAPADYGTVFRIAADAHGAGPALVGRAAVVKLGFSSNGRPWRVLSWDTAPPRR